MSLTFDSNIEIVKKLVQDAQADANEAQANLEQAQNALKEATHRMERTQKVLIASQEYYNNIKSAIEVNPPEKPSIVIKKGDTGDTSNNSLKTYDKNYTQLRKVYIALSNIDQGTQEDVCKELIRLEPDSFTDIDRLKLMVKNQLYSLTKKGKIYSKKIGSINLYTSKQVDEISILKTTVKSNQKSKVDLIKETISYYQKSLTVGEIRIELKKRTGIDMPSNTLASRLKGLVKNGKIKRTGEWGEFSYSRNE